MLRKHVIVVTAAFLALLCGWLLLKAAAYLYLPSKADGAPVPVSPDDETKVRSEKARIAEATRQKQTPSHISANRSSSLNHEELIRALHSAKTKSEADAIAASLGSNDYSSAKFKFISDGICGTLSSALETFPDFASSVAAGATPDTPAGRQSFDYLRTRFEQFCDPEIDYFPRTSKALRDALALDRDGPYDAQLMAKLRQLPKEQLVEYSGYLSDLLANTDSPEMLADAASLLISSGQWSLGQDLVQGTALASQLKTIQEVAVNLAYCSVAGTCNVPDSFDAMQECVQGGLCYPGITYEQIIQQETPPQQFALAQTLAQRILQARWGK